MRNDPIIEEIHKYRREHAAKFGYDIHKIIADLKTREAASGHPIVHRKPRRIKPAPAVKR